MTETTPRTGSSYHYIASRVKLDGSLVAQCANYKNHCSFVKNTPQPIHNFVPGDNRYSGSNRAAFLEALDDHEAAMAAGDLEAARDARARIHALRSGYCIGCKLPEGYLSSGQQECYNNWQTILANMSLCACGQQATQANHRPGETKVLAVSSYMAWPSKGGVASQTAEYAKCDDICACCHQLDPLSKTGRRVGNPTLLPRGKRNGTQEERDAYNRRLKANIRYPKQLFIDRVKLAVALCFVSGKRVTDTWISNAEEAHCVCFDWDHFDRNGMLAERFKKETRRWIQTKGKNKGKEATQRMSPGEWSSLNTKEYSLSKIGHGKIIPDILRCRLVAHDVHTSWERPGASTPEWTLAEAEAYEAMTKERIQWVLDTYYGGQLTEEHDCHEEEEEDNDSASESDGDGGSDED